MTATLQTRRRSSGIDRIALTVGLALVSWSRRREATSARAENVLDPSLPVRDRARDDLLVGQGISHTLFR